MLLITRNRESFRMVLYYMIVDIEARVELRCVVVRLQRFRFVSFELEKIKFSVETYVSESTGRNNFLPHAHDHVHSGRRIMRS